MKKIYKTQPQPQELEDYLNEAASPTWDDFYHGHSNKYGPVKALIFEDQGYICAYCETKVKEPHMQRIEHFHSKSDKSTTCKDWAFDWSNMIGVCKGGTDSARDDSYPLPSNLSCDAHKDHLIQKKKLNIACEGEIINPLKLTALNLFELDKASGELRPNTEKCQQMYDSDSKVGNTENFLRSTIDALNLNCDRLKADRLVVLRYYNKEIRKGMQAKNKKIHDQIANIWFRNRWPSFFTTRRILLGEHAEKYLNTITPPY